MDVFKKLVNKVQEKYRQKQEEGVKYQELLTTCASLPHFYPLPYIDKKLLTISYQLLMDMCPDLNESDAVIVRSLIPLDEICFSCLYATECKSNLKFYFVVTTKYLWLINKEGYLKYRYQDFTVDIIKSGLLSKTLLLGNMLFNVNGTNDILLEFVKLFQDVNYREELIHKQEQIFCDTIPFSFYLNDLASGISIGQNHEIVFHTKEFHCKYYIQDIKNYELLLDDIVVREKKSNRKSLLTANKTSCYQMNLRVTTSDRVFLIPIIEKTAFMTLYSSTSNIFMENRDFADKLVNLLDDLDEKMLNGEI